MNDLSLMGCVCVCVCMWMCVYGCVRAPVQYTAEGRDLKLVIVVLKSVRRRPAVQTLPLYMTSGGEREGDRGMGEGETDLMRVLLCDVYLEK